MGATRGHDGRNSPTLGSGVARQHEQTARSLGILLVAALHAGPRSDTLLMLDS